MHMLVDVRGVDAKPEPQLLNMHKSNVIVFGEFRHIRHSVHKLLSIVIGCIAHSELFYEIRELDD